MTKAERAKVKEAIRLLMAEDGAFERAVGILCELAGMRYAGFHDTQNLEVVDIPILMRQMDAAESGRDG